MEICLANIAIIMQSKENKKSTKELDDQITNLKDLRIKSA
jgi:hypothetical protein